MTDGHRALLCGLDSTVKVVGKPFPHLEAVQAELRASLAWQSVCQVAADITSSYHYEEEFSLSLENNDGIRRFFSMRQHGQFNRGAAGVGLNQGAAGRDALPRLVQSRAP